MVSVSGKLIDFTEDGNNFAHSSSDGILRIWHVPSSSFLHEYIPANNLTATTSCIRYAPLQRKYSKKRKKSGNKEKDTADPTKFIALGTISGSVLVYDYARQELHCNLKQPGSAPVQDLCWDEKHHLYSIGRNQVLVQWDVNKKEMLREISVEASKSFCHLYSDNFVVGSKALHLVSLSNPDKSLARFTGHTSNVSIILPLKKEDMSVDYFISCAVDDNNVSVWNISNGSQEIVSSLVARDLIKSVSVGRILGDSVNLAVCTQKGNVRVFSLHLNGQAKKPLASQCLIKFGETVKKTIPVVGCHLIDNQRLIVSYGSSNVLKFEVIEYSQFKGEVLIKRTITEEQLNHESNLLKTVTPVIDKDTTHLRPGYLNTTNQTISTKRKHGDDTGEKSLPMEERLKGLVAEGKFSLASGPPSSNNCSQLLLQGLHSNDTNLISNVLSQGKDQQIVNNTIQRLPSKSIVPLINHLKSYTTNKGYREFSYMVWLKSILYHHMSYLSTLPDRQTLLAPFYAESSAILSTQHKFKQLQCRLDMILTQMSKVKADPSPIAEPEALLVYKDDSSDEDDNLDLKFGASESDDNWDDMSDYMGQSEDSEMEVDETRENKNNKNDSDDSDVEEISDDEQNGGSPKVNGIANDTDDSDDSDEDEDGNVVVL